MSDLLARMRARFHSPALASLGVEIVAVDGEAGTAHLRFDPGPQACNPVGVIQGGMAAVMLDGAASVAMIAKSDMTKAPPTLEFKVSFLKPVPRAPLDAHGRCLRLGRTIAFLEADLMDQAGQLLARLTATAKPVDWP